MKLHKVIETRLLTDSTYILRFERLGLQFTAGQFICVGLPEDEDRPYSIYSGESDDFIEILIKEIDQGNVSRKLKLLQPETLVQVNDPFGYFTLPDESSDNFQYVFVATGTGIAPFHSIIRSKPSISYSLIHGVRFSKEAYESDQYPVNQYVLCTSGDNGGHYPGRVTDYLKNTHPDLSAKYFLCGNSAMIDSVYDLLVQIGVSPSQIRTEMYF